MTYEETKHRMHMTCKDIEDRTASKLKALENRQ